MRSSSYDTESAVQQGRNGIRGYLKSLTVFFKCLAALIELTEAEQAEAGIHIDRRPRS
jgi:hypothetical protein